MQGSILSIHSNQLNSCLQLAWAAVKVRSGSADATVTSKRFQNVDGSSLVCKVC